VTGTLTSVDVSRETLDRLKTYEAMLAKWTQRINLISKASATQIWDRHIMDSFQLFDEIPKDARSVVDLGSGGGLPGVVLAILLDEKNPKTTVTLIESDQRKAAFLHKISADLNLGLSVRNDRILSLESLQADVVTARALAPLHQLLEMVKHHLSPSGLALLMKGRAFQAEIDEARQNFSFSLDLIHSRTDADARILKIEEIVYVDT